MVFHHQIDRDFLILRFDGILWQPVRLVEDFKANFLLFANTRVEKIEEYLI